MQVCFLIRLMRVVTSEGLENFAIKMRSAIAGNVVFQTAERATWQQSPMMVSSSAMAQFPGPPPGPPPAFAGPPPGGPGPAGVARGVAAGAVGAGVAAGAYASDAYASDDYYGCSRRNRVRVYDAYSDSYVYRCR